MTLWGRRPVPSLDIMRAGARGNGRRDDTKALQLALDIAAERGGGNIFFPRGSYRTTSPLIPRGSGIRLHATVGLANDAIRDHAKLGRDNAAVILNDHEEACFLLESGDWQDVEIDHIGIRQDRPRVVFDDDPTFGAAILCLQGGWHKGFSQNLHIHHCNISRFPLGIQFARFPGEKKEVCAGVSIEHNCIEVCNRGIHCSKGTRVNNLNIINNPKIRHNYLSGISVACTVGDFSGNNLEGQRNPLHIGSSDLGDTSWDVHVSGNYFEKSMGDYSVLLYRVRRFFLDQQRDYRPQLDHQDASIQLKGCNNGTVFGPASFEGCGDDIAHFPRG